MLLKDLIYVINPSSVVIVVDYKEGKSEMKEWYRYNGMNREVFDISTDRLNHLIIEVGPPK